MTHSPTPVHALYWLRTARHLTGREVARRVGCSLASYTQWETGRVCPQAHWLARLSRVLKVRVSRVLVPRREGR